LAENAHEEMRPYKLGTRNMNVSENVEYNFADKPQTFKQMDTMSSYEALFYTDGTPEFIKSTFVSYVQLMVTILLVLILIDRHDLANSPIA